MKKAQRKAGVVRQQMNKQFIKISRETDTGAADWSTVCLSVTHAHAITLFFFGCLQQIIADASGVTIMSTVRAHSVTWTATATPAAVGMLNE